MMLPTLPPLPFVAFGVVVVRVAFVRVAFAMVRPFI
jgi:hypothetical protein